MHLLITLPGTKQCYSADLTKIHTTMNFVTFIIYRNPVFSWGEGNGTPLQYSCLENSMDGGAWWAAVHGAAESRTRLSDFPFTFHFHALEKEMATHSSVLAWRIPGTEKCGGLPSMGSHRVGHDWSDLAVAAAEEKKKGYEKIFEEIIVENFPNMEKEIVNQVQEAQRVPYRINPRRNTPRHILIKLTKSKHKEY